MPRDSYKNKRNNYKWTKQGYHDYDRVTTEDDFLRLRHNHRGSQRRIFASGGGAALVKNAMKEMIPQPTGETSAFRSTGLVHGEAWVRIVMVYGAPLTVPKVQELINTCLGTQLRFYNSVIDGNNVVMYAKIRTKQLPQYRKSIQSLRQSFENNSASVDLSVTPEPKVPGVGGLPGEWLAALRQCVSERYQAANRSLDLSSLHTEPTLLSQGLYLPLSAPSVVQALLQILKENGAQLSLLNLSGNGLRQLNAFAELRCSTVSVERMDLSANPIQGVPCLVHLGDVPGLTELDLTDTPVAMRFQRQWPNLVSRLQSVVPNLRKLNNVDLTPAVQFAVEQGINNNNSNKNPSSAVDPRRKPLPESVLGCFPSEDVGQRLLSFLKDYLSRYDSGPERGEQLLSFYTTSSQLVFSAALDARPAQPSFVRLPTTTGQAAPRVSLGTGRLPPIYFEHSRNLLRCRDPHRRQKLVARGALGVTALLQSLPASEHLLESLSVDVVFHSATQLLFTFAGVFYELQRRQQPVAQVSKVLRCFSRTMIVVAPEGHILQDDLVVSNPSPALRERYITAVARAARTTGGADDDKKDGNEATRLVSQLRQATGMNEAFSRKCLEEYQWDLGRAAEAFRQLHANGQIPAEAFSS